MRDIVLFCLMKRQAKGKMKVSEMPIPYQAERVKKLKDAQVEETK